MRDFAVRFCSAFSQLVKLALISYIMEIMVHTWSEQTCTFWALHALGHLTRV
jgi:hypothetical protein